MVVSMLEFPSVRVDCVMLGIPPFGASVVRLELDTLLCLVCVDGSVVICSLTF